MEASIKNSAIDSLNRIMELELAGVVKYSQYSFMIYGYNRIPIVAWMKGNAEESLAHAHRAGELVSLLGGHPSLKIGPLLETAPGRSQQDAAPPGRDRRIPGVMG